MLCGRQMSLASMRTELDEFAVMSSVVGASDDVCECPVMIRAKAETVSIHVVVLSDFAPARHAARNNRPTCGGPDLRSETNRCSAPPTPVKVAKRGALEGSRSEHPREVSSD